MKIREEEVISWRVKYRPELHEQAIYPRPVQEKLHIWLGVGGTPASFERTGTLELPLMLAVISGQTEKFRPLVDLYRQSAERAGVDPSTLKIGLHSFGFVAETREEAIELFFPKHNAVVNKIGKERGWPPSTRESFDFQANDKGAIVVGSPEEVVAKLKRHSDALGGIDRFNFQLDVGITHLIH